MGCIRNRHGQLHEKQENRKDRRVRRANERALRSREEQAMITRANLSAYKARQG